MTTLYLIWLLVESYLAYSRRYRRYRGGLWVRWEVEGLGVFWYRATPRTTAIRPPGAVGELSVEAYD